TYALTAKGADFVPVLIALQAWGDGHCAAPEGAPIVIRHDGCGASFVPEIRCSACGGTLDIGNVMVRRSAACT
ncbi:MAG: transcriptional regulator, partial [Alphaproteobacteria bacterium]|nr:transcriptional regulator [Alphaproteobacteria bacterium]